MTLRNQLIVAGAWDANDPRDPSEDIAAAWQLADALGLAVAPVTVYEGEGRHGVDPEYRWWAAWPADDLMASREEIEYESDTLAWRRRSGVPSALLHCSRLGRDDV